MCKPVTESLREKPDRPLSGHCCSGPEKGILRNTGEAAAEGPEWSKEGK